MRLLNRVFWLIVIRFWIIATLIGLGWMVAKAEIVRIVGQ